MKANAQNGLGVRAQQAQQTRQKILKAAIKVFAKSGFAGGRVDSISKLAKSHDRMIYYYFGSKEKLFVEVLETLYEQFNEAERRLQLDTSDPVAALSRIVDFTWRYYLTHPEFVALLGSENLHRGIHVKKSVNVKSMSDATLSMLQPVLEAGQQQGLFREDISVRNLYLMIASLGYFYNSNRYTLSSFLGENLMTADALVDWQAFITDAVLRKVCVESPA